MKKLLILLIILITPTISLARDYYFTSSNYNKLKSLILKGGDRVFFKRGDIFNGRLIAQSGSEGRWLYYGAYGHGDMPVLTTDKHEDIIDGSPQWVIFQNLHLTEGSRHGFGFDDGTHDIIILDCLIDKIGGGRDAEGLERLGNAIEFWRNAYNIIVYNNVIDRIYDAGLTNQGLGGHYTQHNIIYRKNRVSRSQYGYEFFKPHNADISNIYVYQNIFDLREPSYKVKLRKWNIQRTYQLWDTDKSIDIKFISNKENK